AAALSAVAPPADMTALVEENFGAGDAGTKIVDAIADYVETRSKQDEGPWHRLGRFEKLPKAVDSSVLSHATFRDLARHAASQHWQASQLLFDVTSGFEGVDDLLAIAKREGAAVTLLFDLAAASFNPLSASVKQRLHAGVDVAVTDAADAMILTPALGLSVGVIDVATAVADLDDSGNPNDLLAAMESGADRLRVQPWLWAATPVGPFESALRVIDGENAAAHDAVARNWMA
ncbi:MAG: hypothetical protein KIT23_12830, partial [Sphingopyxis sp.]|nr:hypothetical protein [Sphingopyxis sp.]